jgi:hypothetical protein
MSRNVITIIVSFLAIFLSLSSLAYPLTEKEKQKLVKATKEQRYDIVSKIMMKEFKENCKVLLKDPEKSQFKSIEQLLFMYSEGFMKIYILNAKKNGYIFKTQKDLGMIKVRFIMELYDIYKSFSK